MTYTYTWDDAEQTTLRREAEDGSNLYISKDSGSRGWQQFIRDGAEVAPYVAPPEPEPLTAEEKLANAGLTVDELKELLGL